MEWVIHQSSQRFTMKSLNFVKHIICFKKGPEIFITLAPVEYSNGNIQNTHNIKKSLNTVSGDQIKAKNHFLKKLLMQEKFYKKFFKHCLAFPKKRFQLCYSKICKKSGKCHFPTLWTFVFHLNVISKPSFKMVPKTNFEFQ